MNDIVLFALPDCMEQDYTAHNEASRSLYAAFQVHAHDRIPIRLNTNPRMLMLDAAYNTRNISYQKYMTDPEIMGQAVLEWNYWVRFLLPGDHEKGLPETWPVHVDFQNVYDAVSVGGPVHFYDNQVPDAAPFLNDDNKRMVFDQGLPEPFTGEWPERALHFLEYFERKSKNGWTFLGRPVEALRHSPFLNTDGPFTAAATLRGATGLCTDLLVDPDYAHTLLDYLTDAFIARMKAWRQLLGLPLFHEEWGMADDSVEMLSLDQYQEFVLPRHRRMYNAFCPQGERSIHLCGNAQRLFPLLKEALNIRSFDTGFPVDFARFREEMGPDVLLYGGPRAPLFVEPAPDALLAETERILRSGILEGGRFVLQEGNNLPPCSPLGHCVAFYELGKTLGAVPRTPA